MQSQRRTDIRAPLLLSSIYLNSDVLPAKGPGKIAAILLGLLLFLLGLLLHLYNFWAKMQLVEILGGHTNSLGFGGHNASLALSPYRG